MRLQTCPTVSVGLSDVAVTTPRGCKHVQYACGSGVCNTELSLEHGQERTQLLVIVGRRRRQEIFVDVSLDGFDHANDLPNLEAMMFSVLREGCTPIHSDIARRMPVSGCQVYAAATAYPCHFAVRAMSAPLLLTISPGRNLTHAFECSPRFTVYPPQLPLGEPAVLEEIVRTALSPCTKALHSHRQHSLFAPKLADRRLSPQSCSIVGSFHGSSRTWHDHQKYKPEKTHTTLMPVAA